MFAGLRDHIGRAALVSGMVLHLLEYSKICKDVVTSKVRVATPGACINLNPAPLLNCGAQYGWTHFGVGKGLTAFRKTTAARTLLSEALQMQCAPREIPQTHIQPLPWVIRD